MMKRESGKVGGCMIAGIVALAVVLIGGCVSVGSYNGIVTSHEKVDAEWSGIQSQYQRRYELVPQLVETVKGAANFEKSTITAVTEARASVGKLQLPDSLPDDPAQIEAFFKAQEGLKSALSRLLVTVEAYPELKATRNFQDLQTAIEGTENRIAVARRDYIDAVKNYNTTIRRFPGNLIATLTGFERLPQLQTDEAVTTVPTIDFGGESE